jgi:hypothetical protein
VLRLLTYQLECGKMGCIGDNGYRGLGFDPGEWA